MAGYPSCLTLEGVWALQQPPAWTTMPTLKPNQERG